MCHEVYHPSKAKLWKHLQKMVKSTKLVKQGQKSFKTAIKNYSTSELYSTYKYGVLPLMYQSK